MQALLGETGGPVGVGGNLMSLGGVISIAGVFLVFTLALARLSYALATDGFFPAAFRRLHPRTGTPYFGILFQAVSALVFSTLFGLGSLLSIAVLFLSIWRAAIPRKHCTCRACPFCWAALLPRASS